ncbi:Hint domain-containing protein [Mesorhizobium sp. LHD-90]|uniref:Hint domain-containing protein n=1 Tax=Mesorhizobium sp. LHD-90 TaxID=3071414 RepID=UPI0027E013ED|nr:Hint domain-containing protein [Mesorhizobium sp. LHD-90]MDQ6438158.1 Hint domain-containing protein [Mesorhizobium sp. LHD-90]
MAVYNTSFFYELDQNGNSTNGHVDAQVANGAANATEVVDDGTNTISVGEEFTVAFSDSGTDAQYGGTYTYVGHASPFSGFIAEDTNGEFFLFSNDDSIAVGTNLTGFVAEDIPLCFLAGTMIGCPGGERAVETLSIGDPVLTQDGRAVPVKWLGRQTLSTFFGIPAGRRPVCISAGALGGNLPSRDLRLTSTHALLIDGVLVHAGALVNGTTIKHIPTDELGERFVVYHIETENHEIVLAEGAAAETFIDNVSRERFDNYAEYQALYGEAPPAMEELRQPRAMSHRQVPASIRARIARGGGSAYLSRQSARW